MNIKQPFLNTLNKGDTIDHFLIIKRWEMKLTKANKTYISLDLGDSSFTLPANIWDNAESYNQKFSSGFIVKVEGIIEEYNGSLQIRIANIKLPKASDNVSIADFLPHSKRPIDEMKKEFEDFLGSIKNEYLYTLLIQIFSKEAKEKYFNAPAGKQIHHAYIHGLLEHTLEIIKICDLMCSFHNEVNRDLLITAAILHDFSKTEELKYESSFEYSDQGKLIGHIVMAAMLINEKSKKIENFPAELRDQLIHLVLSHQGKLEHASPVIPKTLEAIILYHADELSAKTNAYKTAIELDTNKESNWTKYISSVSTELYKSKKDNGQSKSTLFD